MSKSRFDRVNLSASLRPTSSDESANRPFHMLVLGNFGGARRSTGGELKIRVVDRDNLEAMLAGIDVTLKLQIPLLGAVNIHIGELDDFHPDRLYERLELFDRLRDLRDRLDNPRTFAEAARELGDSAQEPIVPASDGDLLDQILAVTEGTTSTGPSAEHGYELNRFLARAVHEYLVPGADPRLDELVEKVDTATADLMRSILHHPTFQAAESAWRSLVLLTRRLDTDENLKIYFADVASGELANDLASNAHLAKSALGKALLPEDRGGTPGSWTAIVGLYEFGQDAESLATLGALAEIAQEADAPFLAAASAELLGIKSLSDTPDSDDWQPLNSQLVSAWNSLRSQPTSAYVGLALPRFLLRMPYSPNAAETETFPFEEIRGLGEHDSYLWANPAVAIGCLLATAYSEQGGDFQLGTWLELGSLPLHVVTSDDEPEAKPCAEVLLSDETIEAILDRGLIPLASHRDSDLVSVPRVQSIADPPQPLAGRW